MKASELIKYLSYIDDEQDFILLKREEYYTLTRIRQKYFKILNYIKGVSQG